MHAQGAESCRKLQRLFSGGARGWETIRRVCRERIVGRAAASTEPAAANRVCSRVGELAAADPAEHNPQCDQGAGTTQEPSHTADRLPGNPAMRLRRRGKSPWTSLAVTVVAVIFGSPSSPTGFGEPCSKPQHRRPATYTCAGVGSGRLCRFRRLATARAKWHEPNRPTH